VTPWEMAPLLVLFDVLLLFDALLTPVPGGVLVVLVPGVTVPGLVLLVLVSSLTVPSAVVLHLELLFMNLSTMLL